MCPEPRVCRGRTGRRATTRVRRRRQRWTHPRRAAPAGRSGPVGRARPAGGRRGWPGCRGQRALHRAGRPRIRRRRPDRVGLRRLAGLAQLAEPALLGVGVGLDVGVSGRRTGLGGRLRGTCGEGARLLLWGRPGGQVGLHRAPRSGLGAGSRTRDGTGRLPRNLLLGACGVEHVLVDEDGPGVELIAPIGAVRAGGRRLGCVVVRHEVPLSRVQHHAIPDPRRKTHRHPDRPEANALTAGPTREPGNPLGSHGGGRNEGTGNDEAPARCCAPGLSLWRRWGDSNSRGASTPTSLAGRRTRPLCDISIAFPRLRRGTHGQPTGRMPREQTAESRVRALRGKATRPPAGRVSWGSRSRPGAIMSVICLWKYVMRRCEHAERTCAVHARRSEDGGEQEDGCADHGVHHRSA